MNDFQLLKNRDRKRKLLIVEGEHEKYKLFKLILQTFQEIDISIEDIVIYETNIIEDIVIYETNIYVLHKQIAEYYGDEWYNEDVDLPHIIGKHNNKKIDKNSYTNIFLIFDYERHDPYFSEDKIEKLQRYFIDSADMGKLYINYPMIESYQHHNPFPDAGYDELFVSVALQPGSRYKGLVKDTFIARLIDLPEKLEKLLSDRFGIGDIEACKKCTQKLLEISNPTNLLENINQVLLEFLSDSEIQVAKKQIYHWLKSKEHIQNSKSYYDYMREIFIQIVLHNISKGSKIQNINSNDNRYLFELLDLSKILNIQNNVSRDTITGYIWVLNTCVFIIPDYNFSLVE